MKPRLKTISVIMRQTVSAQGHQCARRAFTTSPVQRREDEDYTSQKLPSFPQNIPYQAPTRSSWDQTVQDSQLIHSQSLHDMLQELGDQSKRVEDHIAATYGSPEDAEAEDEEIDPDVFKMHKPLVAGDVYSPNDFSLQEYKAWQTAHRQQKRENVFQVLGEDPIKYYKNFNLLADFVTEMGRIKHRDETGLTGVQQRKVAKAVRRAIGIGLLPSVHKHPELIKNDQRRALKRQY